MVAANETWCQPSVEENLIDDIKRRKGSDQPCLVYLGNVNCDFVTFLSVRYNVMQHKYRERTDSVLIFRLITYLP